MFRISGDDSFEVESILDKRRNRKGQLEYFVKWKNYPDTDSTWERASQLTCSDLIEAFEAERQINNPKNQIIKISDMVCIHPKTKRSIRPPFKPLIGYKYNTKDLKILRVKNEGSELCYEIQWRFNNKITTVPARIANREFPNVVIHYLEKRMKFEEQIIKKAAFIDI